MFKDQTQVYLFIFLGFNNFISFLEIKLEIRSLISNLLSLNEMFFQGVSLLRTLEIGWQ